MNNLDKQYQALLQDILDNGVTKQDRTGTGTISVFGRQIRHNMKDGFPLLTTKKMAWKQIVTELLWFLRGDTNIKYLVDNDCHIWDGDAYKRYCTEWAKYPSEGVFSSNEYSSPTEYEAIRFTQEEFINKIKTDDEFAKTWGELGPIYGKQWREWSKFNEKIYTKQVREVPEGGGFPQTRNINWVGGSEVVYIDQIANLINDLKSNPDSRRLMVSAWNVGELDQMVLPPCHYGFQVYTRELSFEERYVMYIERLDSTMVPLDIKVPNIHQYFTELNIPTRAISLMWSQRSCDFPLGIPANIMSYAILLMMLAKQVNMIPEELIGNFGDCHIYLNQIDGVKEQLTREPYPLPGVKLSDKVVNDLSEYTYQDIILENYQSHPKIYFPLSN